MFGPGASWSRHFRDLNKLQMLVTAGTLGYGVWQYWKKRKRSGSMFGLFANIFGNMPTLPFNGNFPIPEGETLPFGRVNGSPKDIVLKSASIKGEIEGLLFTSVIRQEYKNETDKPLEIIYTFPMGWDTVLLGLEAELDGKKLEGRVTATREAEDEYEKAVSKGDAAIMVQQSSLGLFTANLGNIKPGESVSVEIRAGRLLNYEQTGIRLAIPTVIGQRYGNAHGPGALAPHESAEVDKNASYDFSLELVIKGDLAGHDISCPTHKTEIVKEGGKTIARLAPGAKLDRDFVLLIRGQAMNARASRVQDGENWLLAASFAPKIPHKNISPMALKILVDCSGSMAGQSIGQARKGLARALKELRPEDHVSYSRFGSEVEHATNKLLACGEDTLKKLSTAIDTTEADMGGTELEGALRSTFSLHGPDNVPSIVLLITDGDVWNIPGIIAAAKNSGHRVFAVGVGSAPAESLLRELAERTGGACEFATPNENMADVIVKMFYRMRGATAANIHVEWPEKPIWSTRAPAIIYDGETVHSFALFKNKPEGQAPLKWRVDGVENSVSASIEDCASGELVRLGWNRHMLELEQPKEKLKIALKYQLVSDQTSLILVHERSDGEKVTGLPKVCHVAQMPAHGHGCAPMNFAGIACFSPLPLFGMPNLSQFKNFISRNQDTGEAEPEAVSARARPLVDLWRDKLYELQDLSQFMALLRDDDGLCRLREKIGEIALRLGVPEEAVYAMLIAQALEYVGENGETGLDRHSRRLLDAALKDTGKVEQGLILTAIDEEINLI